MSFEVAAEAYDGFMGRYSALLSPQLLRVADLRVGQRALDVGCGPGALTGELVAALGADAVSALDPSPPFVEAARARHRGATVVQASAEAIPFADDAFDHAFAQLVVHFMADPVAGLREMRRVTRAGGSVVACVWDLAGGRAPLSVFWEAARQLDGGVRDESQLAGARSGDLARLFREAGMADATESVLEIRKRHATFDEWWQPYTKGVGPAGAYAAGLTTEHLDALRDRCRTMLPPAPFDLVVAAWTVRATA